MNNSQSLFGTSNQMDASKGELDQSLASQNANVKLRKSEMLPANSSLFTESSSESTTQNVQVILRVRPLTFSYHTKSDGQGHQLMSSVVSEEQNLAQNRCIKSIVNNNVLVLHKSDEQFTFDFIAGEDITQDVMFQRLGKPIVDFCLQGYNSTIFAYGQTGSGKTHTIQGKDNQSGANPQND